MKIVAFANKNSGPGYHRIIMPLLLMKDVDVYVTNNLKDEDLEGCDVFMYNRVLPPEAFEQIHLLQKQHGFRICVDIDDYWELDPHHILFDHYQEINFAFTQISQISAADIILTTHDRLADEIKHLNKNVHVCPNAIPHEGQFAITTEPHYLTRLFWQGSITHREDIGIIKTAVNALGPLSAKIKMVMAGYTEGEPEWHKMAIDYTANLKHQYKLILGELVSDYYKSYQHADICLIPLLNSKFNRHKSNLKVLEAANMGLPVICSQVHPYMDLPVLYAKSSVDWVKHIERLLKSRKRQKEAGQELKEYCDIHFNFYKINEHRKQILSHQFVKA